MNIWGLMSALCVWKSNNKFNWAVQKRRNSVWSLLSLSTGEITTQQLKTNDPSGPRSADSGSVCSQKRRLVLIPLHWGAGCHLTWMRCPRASWPAEASHRCPAGTPSAFCLWAPAEQNRATGRWTPAGAAKCHSKSPPKRRDSQPPANRSSSAPRLFSGVFLATAFPSSWVPGFSLAFAPHSLPSLENLGDWKRGREGLPTGCFLPFQRTKDF